jgi:hypothetical protein
MLIFTSFTKPQGQALLLQHIYPNKNLIFSFIRESWAKVKNEFLIHISCIPNKLNVTVKRVLLKSPFNIISSSLSTCLPPVYQIWNILKTHIYQCFTRFPQNWPWLLYLQHNAILIQQPQCTDKPISISHQWLKQKLEIRVCWWSIQSGRESFDLFYFGSQYISLSPLGQSPVCVSANAVQKPCAESIQSAEENIFWMYE